MQAAIKAQQAITDAELVENYRRYTDENLAYRDFMQQQYEIKSKGIDAQIELYGKDSDEAQALSKKKTELEKQYQQDMLKIEHLQSQIEILNSWNIYPSIVHDTIRDTIPVASIPALVVTKEEYKKVADKALLKDLDVKPAAAAIPAATGARIKLAGYGTPSIAELYAAIADSAV